MSEVIRFLASSCPLVFVPPALTAALSDLVHAIFSSRLHGGCRLECLPTPPHHSTARANAASAGSLATS
eukprot:2981910-Prymnesium_polylepis.1